MQRITLGDFELIAVSDGIYHLDGGGMFGVVPKSLWERKLPRGRPQPGAVGVEFGGRAAPGRIRY